MSAAMLDFDRDGWMDVALGNISKPRFRLLRNTMKSRLHGGENGFVAVRLVGGNAHPESAPGWSARDALGARVELNLSRGRRIVREYTRNGGFKSQSTGTLLVGIGSAPRARSVRILWPSGREQTIRNIEAGTLVTVYENPRQSPTGEAAIREPYARDVNRRPQVAVAGPETLRIEGAHGNQGLTVYTTMSTFCASCAKSQPDLHALRSAFGEDKLTLVGIPVAKTDTASRLKTYVEKKNPAYEVQIGLPPEITQHIRDMVSTVLHANGETTPASIVTDASGRILATRWGVPTLSELRQLEEATEKSD